MIYPAIASIPLLTGFGISTLL